MIIRRPDSRVVKEWFPISRPYTPFCTLSQETRHLVDGRQSDYNPAMPIPFRRIAFLMLLSLFLVSCQSPPEEEPPPDTNVPGTLFVAGDTADIQTTVQPGLALVGGGSRSNEAYAWLIGRSGGGDFVFLTTTDYADSEDEQFYREMRALGQFDSLATLTVNSRDKADGKNPGR